MTKFSTSTARKESLSDYLRRLWQLILDLRLWANKRSELSLFLQRSFWKPLRNTAEIFHVLPLVAVVILFVLLATDGQLREIYISYLEHPSDGALAASIRMAAALIAIGLLSAVLFETHNALSTMRINNIVYSTHPDPAANYNLRRLQRAAAFLLAFTPWLGVTVGLFGARNFVAARYCQLLNKANVPQATLENMHFLAQVGGLEAAAAIIILGAAAAVFAGVDDRNRLAQYAVAWIAPALGGLLFLLLTDQWNADAAWWSSVPLWAWVAVAAATGAYLWVYYRFYHRPGVFWFARPFTRIGISFRKRRRRRLAWWALLPWLGLTAYFLLSKAFLGAGAASSSCSEEPGSPVGQSWAIFPVAMCCTIALGILVGYFLIRCNPDKRRLAVIVIVCALAAAAAGLSVYNDPDLVVAVYRTIGPLAAICLELVFLIATFGVLAVLSQNSGFPALTLVVLTIVICVMFPNYAALTAGVLGLLYFCFAIVAFVSGRIWSGLAMAVLIVVGLVNVKQVTQGTLVPQNVARTAATASSAMTPMTVRSAYLCWLDRKGIPAIRTAEQQSLCTQRPQQPRTVKKPYPVFIVAAEGGGIYAASAAATFLAHLEDRAPGFARHIFAISGVSGGSIGAATFHALSQARNSPDLHANPNEGSSAGDEQTCTRQLATKIEPDLSTKVANIMRDDHLSPIVGSIFPEMFDVPMKRPDALTASLIHSAATQDSQAGKNLCAPFVKHWSATADGPALVLNSTWVETGFRVAFAPFRLHELDESLYSFRDPGMPNQNCPKERDPASCISLVTAAGVSARFPGMMPPLSVRLGSDVDHEKRWNFVDGGYSDNSGATTALDIYRALKGIYPDEVDLRVILITSAHTEPNLEDQSVNGTVFLDTLAPVNAILKVREGLANDAVGRACSEIYPVPQTQEPDAQNRETQSKGCIKHAGARDGKLQIVEIQDQTYGLPLGWKISQTSFAVIPWMLGKATDCKDTASDEATAGQTSVQPNDPHAQLTTEILRRNGCVSRLLMELVREDAASGKPLP